MAALRIPLWIAAQALQILAGATLVHVAYAQGGFVAALSLEEALPMTALFYLWSGYVLSSTWFSLIRPRSDASSQARRMAGLFALHASAFVVLFLADFGSPDWAAWGALVGGGAVAVFAINLAMEKVLAAFDRNPRAPQPH